MGSIGFHYFYLKSLPPSLACPRQEKDGQREEKLSLFGKGG
jgi:hypothetical protein